MLTPRLCYGFFERLNLFLEGFCLFGSLHVHLMHFVREIFLEKFDFGLCLFSLSFLYLFDTVLEIAVLFVELRLEVAFFPLPLQLDLIDTAP